jgi:type I restriction enzyme S subunit
MVLAQDLRNAVLQAALQGKLTEQLESDSKVSDLLKSVENCRESLKICKNSLNLESMNIKIPCSWEMVELNSILSFVDYRGKTPNKSTKGIFLITASNIKKGYMDYTRKEYISEKEYSDRQSRGITKKGDLLFTTEAPLGNVALCDLEVSSCGQRVITMQAYCKNTVCLELFMYFLLSPSFQKELLDNCTGTTAKGIKAEKLKHLLVPYPPIEEQQRIVDRINELMEKIDDYEKVEKELVALENRFPDDMKNALLQSAMLGKLTEKLESDSSVNALLEEETVCFLEANEYPYTIPQNWRFASLEELTSMPIKRGKSPKYANKSKMLVFAQKCNQKIGGISLQDAKYLDESIKNKYKEEDYLKNNDIVINSTGGGTLGRIGYITEELINTSLPIVPDSHVTVIRTKKNILSKYIFYFLKYNQAYLESMGVGSTNQTELKPDTIKKLLVPIPPIEEQKRIVERLEQLLPLCETL